jgi:hypothetical protein
MPWKDMTLGEPPKYYSDVYEGGREKEKVGGTAVCSCDCLYGLLSKPQLVYHGSSGDNHSPAGHSGQRM